MNGFWATRVKYGQGDAATKGRHNIVRSTIEIRNNNYPIS